MGSWGWFGTMTICESSTFRRGQRGGAGSQSSTRKIPWRATFRGFDMAQAVGAAILQTTSDNDH